MREGSAVPLPCSTFSLSHGGRQGSGPDRGQSPVEWGDFLSVCEAHPARSEAQPDQRLSQLASQEKRKKARIGFSAGDGDMVVGA